MSSPISRLEFYCPKCTGSALISKHLPNVPILRLLCLQCDATFYQCIFCPIGGLGLNDSRHYTRRHVSSDSHKVNVLQYRLAISSIPTEYNDDDGDSLSSASLDNVISTRHEYIEALKAASLKPTVSQILDTYPDLSTYYEAVETGHGGNYLVEKAIMKEPGNYKSRSHSSTLFMLILSYFTSRLSKNQAILFSSLMAYVKANPNDESLFIPACQNDIRNTIVEGSNSIYSLLPTSRIVEYEGDIVYIPLKDTIRRMFSRKSKFPNIFLPVSQSPHGTSPRGLQLLNPILPDLRGGSLIQTFPLKLILWTDAFQCFNVSVNSDASAHTCTATVGALDGDHSGAYSFPVWLSKKASNRDVLERRLVEEVNELSDNTFPVYHYGIKRMVNVQLKLYTFLCDRPDKSTSLHMLSSKYCARFGYAGDLTKIIDHVICCTDCYSCIVRNETPSPQCGNCFCFDFSRIMYPVEEDNYPLNLQPAGGPKPFMLPMKKLTFSQMSDAVKYCFAQVLAGNWGKKTGKQYLRTEGIDLELSKKCVDNGLRANLYLKRSERPEECRFRVADRRSHPSDYKMPPLPPLWGLSEPSDVGCFIDAYMHLIFLGVQKAISSGLISRFLVPQKKLKSYITTLNIKLGLIHGLNMSYMPIHKSCGDKKLNFGGCLSRHWLTISRLMKWLFNHILTCHPATENANNTRTDHFDFIRFSPAQIRYFCRSRGMPEFDASTSSTSVRVWFSELMESPRTSFAHYTDADIMTFIKEQHPIELQSVYDGEDVEDRRTKFFEYVTLNQWIPPIVSRPNTFIPDPVDELMNDVIVLYHSFVARVMGSCSPQSVDRHAKAFLTTVHKLDNALTGLPNKNPMILLKVNFLTLLNASDSIQRFGSARSLWEGGCMGEGSIPRLKQRIHHMKPGFAKNAIKSFLDKECICDLIEHSIGNIIDDTTLDSTPTVELDNLMAAGATIRTDGGDDVDVLSDSLFAKNDKVRDCYDNLVGFAPHPPKSADPIFLSHQAIEICVHIQSHEMYLYDKGNQEFVNIIVISGPVTVCGAQYFSMKYSSNRVAHTEMAKDRIVCGVMLRHESMTKFYYAVAMNWTELTQIQGGLRQFVTPRCPSFAY